MSYSKNLPIKLNCISYYISFITHITYYHASSSIYRVFTHLLTHTQQGFIRNAKKTIIILF